MRTLSLTQEQIQQMIAHVDAHLPYEACGLLAGRGSSVENVLMVTNQAQSPVRYLMDPIEQLHAFEWIEAQGLDLLGIFHSHPTGPETVSPTDIAEAAYDVVYVIVSRSNGIWHTRGFWIQDAAYNEVTLQIDSTSNQP
ncbi:MAG: M67 family metallopeptidase [Anaerolineales bacterium]|jgi:proteasome lid subunit RPN8/RPN11|uniref:M67 family metallopeptidase n=1 Tax=Candidatus Villigracilis vicinus TaxID=3140679 RepID=UPI003136E460|nr:M67 family metallopeptidase [Anaerolineales bacterium]